MSTQLRDLDNFIQAGSLRGLRRIMQKLDARYRVRHKFKDRNNFIDKNGKLVFYAWYEPTFQELEDEINGDK